MSPSFDAIGDEAYGMGNEWIIAVGGRWMRVAREEDAW
jgi:hypothetical protein